MSNSIVQYVLLRSDLLKEMGWSIGALVAQACHASTAVLHLYKDDAHTIEYLNDLDNMHKVILEVSPYTKMDRTGPLIEPISTLIKCLVLLLQLNKNDQYW